MLNINFEQNKEKKIKELTRNIVLNVKYFYKKNGEPFNYSSLSKQCNLSQGNLSQFFGKNVDINNLPNMGLNIISSLAVGLNVDIYELISPRINIGKMIELNFYDDINNLHLDILKESNQKESISLSSNSLFQEGASYIDKINNMNSLFVRNNASDNELQLNSLILVTSGLSKDFVLPNIYNLFSGKSSDEDLKNSYNNIDNIENGRSYLIKNSNGYCQIKKIFKPNLNEINIFNGNLKTIYESNDIGKTITIIGKAINISYNI